MKFLTGVSEFSQNLDFFVAVMVLICGLVTVGIMAAIIYFCFKYHASKHKNRIYELHNVRLEMTWLILTLFIFMVFFGWAATLYKEKVDPQTADYEIFVYAKRWMWKFHHPNGFTEINNLHIPANKKINFVMISEDVIHSLYFPDFRVKQDLLPENYTTMWLHPLKTGSFPLFCTEYCGTEHAMMKGEVNIIADSDYRLLTHQDEKPQNPGRELFVKHDCLTCHHSKSENGPSLVGIKKDDTKIRRAILYPTKEMPSYKGVLNEGEIRDLVQYIKSMRKIDENLL